ncbi:MAG: peptidylprolyl isomerase [Nitrospinae bacterium]|nr:peptidylprolyl isomerase [Nitrospinota bacterium]
MFLSKALRHFAVFLAVLIFAAFKTPDALAHGGHKHDEAGPRISLPDVLAKAGNADIKKEAIWRELKDTVALYNSKGTPLTPEQEKQTVQKLVDQEIGRVLLLKKAGDLSIQATPEAVESALQAVKAKFPSNEAFEKKLAQRNLTLDQYKENLRMDLLLEQIVQKEVEPRVRVDDKEVREYYEKNLDSFKVRETVRASVILIKVKPDASVEQEKRAREKIDLILSQVKEGSDFSDLAKRFSQDSLGSRGGDIGFFHEKQILPEFGDRAFKMKVGEVSEVFRTGHGFHILKVTERKPAKSESIGEAAEKIKEILKSEKIKKETERYTETLRKNADIKLYF